MRTYTGPSVVVIDELGYLPMDATSARWIFQVVSRRYERLDRPDQQSRLRRLGRQVFADQVVASAILDRLLHRAKVVTSRARAIGCGPTTDTRPVSH